MSNRIPGPVLIFFAVLLALLVLAWPLRDGVLPTTHPTGLLVRTRAPVLLADGSIEWHECHSVSSGDLSTEVFFRRHRELVARTFRGLEVCPTSQRDSSAVPQDLLRAYGEDTPYAHLAAVDSSGLRHSAWLPRASSDSVEEWAEKVHAAFLGLQDNFDIVESSSPEERAQRTGPRARLQAGTRSSDVAPLHRGTSLGRQSVERERRTSNGP